MTGYDGAADDRPVRVMIATPLGRGGKGGMDRMADLVIETIDAECRSDIAVQSIATLGGRGKLIGLMVFVAAIGKVSSACWRRRIDVLHLNTAAYGSVARKLILAEIARFFRVPYIVHLHSGHFETFWRGAPAWQARAVQRLLDGSARVIVLGQGYERLVSARVPGAAERIVVLPNATPSRDPGSRKAQADKVKQITFLGVLTPKKGVVDLVRALGSLAERSDWRATLAGYGEIEANRALADELGVGQRIAFPGWISTEAAGALLDATDIFVLPSYFEGLSMSVLEAFAAGASVIATPVNSLAEVLVDGVNALTVAPGDVAQLARSIERLLDDDRLRERLAEQARLDHARHYDTKGYVQKIRRVWQQVAVPLSHVPRQS